ncbi:Endo-1,4-beta-xylanase B [Frankliniella fusca]|uniref:Endo-1,4-beta-xylanase B n=1 Tax=Frankliniella fusca TaxID=407009 RepID=A0AAE1LEM6_9NEOP|nr:Endo-1,4-beta-xylanase B [Frankliniella fusca]
MVRHRGGRLQDVGRGKQQGLKRKRHDSGSGVQPSKRIRKRRSAGSRDAGTASQQKERSRGSLLQYFPLKTERQASDVEPEPEPEPERRPSPMITYMCPISELPGIVPLSPNPGTSSYSASAVEERLRLIEASAKDKSYDSTPSESSEEEEDCDDILYDVLYKPSVSSEDSEDSENENVKPKSPKIAKEASVVIPDDHTAGDGSEVGDDSFSFDDVDVGSKSIEVPGSMEADKDLDDSEVEADLSSKPEPAKQSKTIQISGSRDTDSDDSEVGADSSSKPVLARKSKTIQISGSRDKDPDDSEVVADLSSKPEPAKQSKTIQISGSRDTDSDDSEVGADSSSKPVLARKSKTIQISGSRDKDPDDSEVGADSSSKLEPAKKSKTIQISGSRDTDSDDSEEESDTLPTAKPPSGSRSVFKCLHPHCLAKDTYHQRLERHYETVHVKGDVTESVRKALAKRLFKKYQQPWAKVRIFTRAETVKSCFGQFYMKREFKKSLREFMVLHGIAIEKEAKVARTGSRVSVPNKLPENLTDTEDEEDIETTNEAITKKELGLLEQPAPTHKLKIAFYNRKLQMAKGAVDPVNAAKTMTQMVGRVIAFVEKMTKEKVDHYDVLRNVAAHQEMIKRLKESDFKAAGKMNFKKAAETLCKYCGPQGKQGAGCLREEADFPTDEAFVNALPKIAKVWSDFEVSDIPLASRVEDIEEIDLSLYDEYFTNPERKTDIETKITELGRQARNEQHKFLKKGNRYDKEISVPYNFVARHLACILTYKCDRGGVAKTLTRNELLNATESEENNVRQMTFSVKNHKNKKAGALEVTLNFEEYEMFVWFNQLREELDKIDNKFKNPILFCGLDGQPITKIYQDIQKWAKEQGEKSRYSSRAMRRQVTTLSAEMHSPKTFRAVGRKQNHSLDVANKSYVLKTRQKAARESIAQENVKLNAILGKEALNNVNWFAFTPQNEVPTREEMEAIIINKTKKKDIPFYKLSDEWYTKILSAVKRDHAKLILMNLAENIVKGNKTLEECVQILNSASDKIGKSSRWKEHLQNAVNSIKSKDTTSA